MEGGTLSHDDGRLRSITRDRWRLRTEQRAARAPAANRMIGSPTCRTAAHAAERHPRLRALMQTDDPAEAAPAISVIAIGAQNSWSRILDMSRITTGTVRLDSAPIQVTPRIHQASTPSVPPPSCGSRSRSIRSTAGVQRRRDTASRCSEPANNASYPAGRSGRGAPARTQVVDAITDTAWHRAGSAARVHAVPAGRRAPAAGMAASAWPWQAARRAARRTIEAASPGRARAPRSWWPRAREGVDVGRRRRSMSATATRPVQARPSWHAGIDVLLVDDEADTLMLFKTTLEAGARAAGGDGRGDGDRGRMAPAAGHTRLPGIDGEPLRAIRAKTAHRTRRGRGHHHARPVPRPRAWRRSPPRSGRRGGAPGGTIAEIPTVADAIESGHERDSHADAL
jgi:hypothetical protein